LPPLAMKSKAEQPAWGMWTPQMLRNEADKVLEAYGIAGEFPDKGDYTSMIEGLEKVQMTNGLLERYVPALRPTIRKGGLHNIALKTVQAIKTVLFSLQMKEEAAAKYKPEFCELCYRHRTKRSSRYCVTHKPWAERKSYQSGKRRADEFFEQVITRYNEAIEAKKIPHGLAMVWPEGFSYENVVLMLSAFPLANAKLLPVVEACIKSDPPPSRFDVLARIYDAALDTDGVDLVRRAEAAGRHRSFRYLQDLMHFVARYEAELLLKDAAPKARGPKVRHSADHIRAVVAASPEKSMVQHAKELGCSRDTLYKAIKEPQ
jgi:DNA-binding phage protein